MSLPILDTMTRAGRAPEEVPMKKTCSLAVLLAALVVLASAAPSAGRSGYYRFPAVHKDLIVFTSEGDLWTVPLAGGTARRLTTHPGMESFPAVSPDGATVAFSAQYDGPTEIYTMPLAGGLPVRRTFSGQTSTPVGWTPDGKILYATQKYSTLPNTQLVVLDPGTGAERPVPLAQAADGSFDGQGRTLFFTRLPFQGSYTKRYRGGTAQNLWKYVDGGGEAVPLTADYPGTSKNPLLWQGRVYFLSDRDGTMNLWSIDLEGRGAKPHTFHRGYDASSPSLHDGRVAYQLVADLHVYDIGSGKDRRVDITLPSDFDQMREKWVSRPAEYLTSAHLSPSGDRVALVSRGQVFVAPVGDGRLVRVTRQEGVRHRSARFLAGGKNLILLSDETGEWEFSSVPADGLAGGAGLTSGAKVLRFDGLPSPDGRRLAFADKDNGLWVADLEKKSQKRAAESANGMFEDLAWSPDSRWLAYVQTADNQFSQVMVLNAESGETRAVTNDRVDSYGPAWTPDGKWLYFLSDRVFQSVVGSPWGARQPEPYFDKTAKVYAVSLTAKAAFPFLPANELLAAGEASEPKEEKKEKKGVEVIIDFDGIQNRTYEVPLPVGVYSGLAANDRFLFVIDRESRATGRAKLQAVEVKTKDVKAKTLVEDIRDFELSADGKKILVQKGP
ncbi:MAG: protease, partial [Candidatus Aminicenantes bacterium]|nr:protease [Candidatus Aminicenantes bacterium]